MNDPIRSRLQEEASLQTDLWLHSAGDWLGDPWNWFAFLGDAAQFLCNVGWWSLW